MSVPVPYGERFDQMAQFRQTGWIDDDLLSYYKKT